MELRENVRVRPTPARTSAPLRLVDFKAGTVVSGEPVTVRLTNGLVEAHGLEVKDGGKVLLFTGRVRTTFAGAAGPAAPSRPPPPAPPPPNRERPAHDPPRGAAAFCLVAGLCAAPALAQATGEPRRRPSAAALATGAGHGRGPAFGVLGFERQRQGADQDRRRPARRLRPGAAGGVQRQRRRRAGRQHHEMHHPHGALRAGPRAGRPRPPRPPGRARATAPSARSTARAPSPSWRRPRSPPATTPPSTGSRTRSCSSATSPCPTGRT